MAVDQDGLAEQLQLFVQQSLQRGVIRLPIVVDPRLGLGQRQFARIDRAPARHHARDHPKARGYARIVRIAPHPFDQRRVKLIRTAVQIDEGTGGQRGQERRTHPGGAVEQQIDKGIFG